MPEMWRIKMNKIERSKGVITLEAVMIFPMVFFIVLTLCYLVFQLCDKVKVESVLENLAREQAIALKEGTALKEQGDYSKISEKGVFYLLEDLSEESNSLKKVAKNRMEKVMILGEIEQIDVKLSHYKVKISAKISTYFGLANIQEYFGGSPYTYELSVSIPVHNPAEFTRSYRALNETIENSKGRKKAKKQLKDIKKK